MDVTECHGSLGNTILKSRSRRWCFTYNNYTNETKEMLISTFKTRKWDYIIGDEIGEEGTPHLQGYIEYKYAIRFDTLKNIDPKIHWEEAKGTREQNIDYCVKDGTYVTSFEIKINIKDELLNAIYKNVIWKPWQQKIIDIVESEADDRTIHWIHEAEGNVGKSFLCKYLACKYDVIIASGKTRDIFNQINTWRLENPNKLQFPITIIDNPRADFGHINYSAIEQIKNGLIYSGKYEGGQILGKSNHVIVFANKEPDRKQLSEDRINEIYLE